MTCSFQTRLEKILNPILGDFNSQLYYVCLSFRWGYFYYYCFTGPWLVWHRQLPLSRSSCKKEWGLPRLHREVTEWFEGSRRKCPCMVDSWEVQQHQAAYLLRCRRPGDFFVKRVFFELVIQKLSFEGTTDVRYNRTFWSVAHLLGDV